MPYWFPWDWLRWPARVLVVVAMAAISYTIGRHSYSHALDEYKENNVQLVIEKGKLSTENTSLEAQISTLQLQLDQKKQQLAALMPLENTYKLIPNQSLTIADGLVIGLIGNPGSQSVKLNINNKQHTAAADDIITFTPDASMNFVKEIALIESVNSLVQINATCTQRKS